MLAIVIPYYNYYYFKETLDSLANQTNKRFKVYIGDDASSNDPLSLLCEYEDKFDFVYKKFDTNLGGISLVKQWERCVSMTVDESWIQILGDDDTLEITAVEYFYKNLEGIIASSCNVIRFASRYIDGGGDLLEGHSDFFHPKIELSTDSFYRNYKGNSRSSLSEHIFKKTKYEINRFYDFPLAWHSDDKAWLEFSSYKEIYTINEALVSVRVSEKSISGSLSNQLFKNKARYLFFKDIVFNKITFFNKNQQIDFLMEYGVLIKEQNKINIHNIVYITFRLIRLGAFISLMKFLKRMYIAKFKTK